MKQHRRVRMRRVLCQRDRLNRCRHRLVRHPIHRRAGGFADISVVVEDLQRQRIFAGDRQVQYLPVARGGLGDVLRFQFLQISFAGFCAHGVENRAGEYRRARTAARRPHHLPFPARIEQILVGLRHFVRFDHPRVVAGGEKIKIRRTPKTLGILELGGILGKHRRVESAATDWPAAPWSARPCRR